MLKVHAYHPGSHLSPSRVVPGNIIDFFFIPIFKEGLFIYAQILKSSKVVTKNSKGKKEKS